MNDSTPAGWTQQEIDAEVYGLEEPEYHLEPTAAAGQGNANWHLRKAVAARGTQEEMRELFGEEIRKIQERLDDRLAVLENQAAWHERSVEMWHRAALAAGDVGKTVHLPHGQSQIRAAQPSTEIFDEDAMRGWLAANDLEAVVYPVKEPTLSRSALKKAVAMVAAKDKEPGAVIAAVHPETGEVVPGLQFRASAPRHGVKA